MVTRTSIGFGNGEGCIGCSEGGFIFVISVKVIEFFLRALLNDLNSSVSADEAIAFNIEQCQYEFTLLIENTKKRIYSLDALFFVWAMSINTHSD